MSENRILYIFKIDSIHSFYNSNLKVDVQLLAEGIERLERAAGQNEASDAAVEEGLDGEPGVEAPEVEGVVRRRVLEGRRHEEPVILGHLGLGGNPIQSN